MGRAGSVVAAYLKPLAQENMIIKFKLTLIFTSFILLLICGCSGLRIDDGYGLPSNKEVKEAKAKEFPKQINANQMAYLDNPIEFEHWVLPTYPLEAIKKEIEGVAVVTISVDENGAVESILFARLAHPVLNEAVVKAINTWRFKPNFSKGKPTKFKVWQHIPFVLISQE